METVKIYGFEVLKYYFFVLKNIFAGYPWQVCVAYGIVCACVLTMVILFIKFLLGVRKNKREEKKKKDIAERFFDKIRDILSAPKMQYSEIVSILEEDVAKLKKNAKYFIPILVSIRTKLNDKPYLPNLATMVNILGITEHCESSLLKNDSVFDTLQMMSMLQLGVSEGYLANYLNHRDRHTRLMARMCYILSSEKEPYKYLDKDMKDYDSLLYFIILHYIFAYLKEQNRKLPDFVALAEKAPSSNMADFYKKEQMLNL